MPQGHALENADTIEVVAAFSAAQRLILAVADAPGWYVLGAFYLPKSCDAMLELQGCVTDGALTLQARLFDIAAAQPVTGMLISSNPTVPTRMRSGLVTLTGAKTYQIQAQCFGAAGDDKFAVISDATISD